MKIYQIYEFGDDYGDYCNHIISSYLDKNKAEAEILKLYINKIKHSYLVEKCKNCPLYNYSIDCSVSDVYNYCDNANLELDCDNEYLCKNYDYGCYDFDYDIKELDVIE